MIAFTRVAALAVAGLLLGCGIAAAAEPAVFEGPVPRADCGPGSVVEPALQGEMPLRYRDSDQNLAGFRCNLEVIGHYPGEGAEWQNAWYAHCDYYDTTLAGGQQSNGTQVLDVSDPAHPKLATNLTSPAMLDPWESLKVNDKRALLGGVYVNGAQGTGFFDVYDVKSDCAHPKLLASVPVSISNHEGNWAPDGKTYYATNFFAGVVTAIDVSNPAAPAPITSFYVDNSIHGLSVSDDGNRLYQTISGIGNPNGLRIIDVSEIQARKAAPQVRTVGEVDWTDGSTAQHTVPIFYGRHPYILFADEGGLGMARIIDIADEAHPRVVSKLKLEIDMPENSEKATEEGGYNHGSGRLATFAYNAHYCTVDREQDPTVAACSYFESGIRIFDIRDVMHPREIAYINVGGSPPGHPGSQRDGGTSSYNSAQVRLIPERGEIWFTDQDKGFYVARFTNGAWPFAEAGQTGTAADLGLPRAHACTSRRSFRIRLRAPGGDRLRSARVYVNGKRVRVVSGRRLRAPVNLRGLPRGIVRVRIVARTRRGRTVRRTRTYRTCAPKR